EKACTATLPKAGAKFEACVVPTVGLWQVPQPTALNRLAPAAMFAADTAVPLRITPPVGGGARNRIKLENAEASSRTSAFEVAVGWEVSSGYPPLERFKQLAGRPVPF